MVEKGKRRYHSPVREQAAQQTRELLTDTARGLFLAQGYASTTMKQVAAGAEVAERTLYLAFPTKAALLNEVIGLAIVGDARSARWPPELNFATIVSERDGSAAIEVFASVTTDLYERAGELLQLGEHGSESDPELRAFADAGARATLDVLRGLTRALADAGELTDRYNPTQAADSAYVLSHFSAHQLLRRRRRWSSARYERWLTATLTADLIDPDQ